MCRTVRRISAWLVPVLAASLLLGCGRKVAVDLPPAQIDAMKMMSLYMGYKRAHNNKPPTNTAEFTKWTKSLKPKELEEFRVQNLDETLVSPRDHEPYQVTPGKPNRMGIAPVIIYEKNGVNGKHFVVGTMGNSGEIDEETLKNSVPNYGG